ncbi:MAG: hypothetical protein Q7S40_15480 [Opitutaceae bacterium]|nr:hypothetical protein [Opitutaceae bacterium]
MVSAVAVVGVLAPVARADGGADYEQPPIAYSATAPKDAVVRLQEQIKRGELQFRGSDLDVLQTLLRALDVPAPSQVVVFSKTSLQRGRIRPKNPRAIYFSDTAYVGWVPGGLIEVATIDPQLGPVFYSLDPQAAREAGPKFHRDTDCLRCHGDMFVRGIPAVFARSLFPTATGEMLLRHGSTVVDDRTPFETRWGGWYVTGYTGKLPHRGNTFATEENDQLVFEATGRRPENVRDYFDPKNYPCDTSDIVALLVIEHQMAMQNSLTRAGLGARKMLAYQKGLQLTFKEPVTDEPAYDSVKSVFASAVEDVLDHLLFREEAALPDGVVGSERFRQTFGEKAPRSSKGHSLKELVLRGHMFANRCSYLIYSPSFRELPPSLKSRILTRLQDVLLNRDRSSRFAYLPADEKQRIYDILRETHPDAKAQWGGEGTNPENSYARRRPGAIPA